jgi:hypothetical protein
MAIRWTKGERAGTVTHEGLVLARGHESYVGYGSYRTAATVWDPERGAPDEVAWAYANSEYGAAETLAEVEVDAPAEVVAAHEAWTAAREAAAAALERRRRAARLERGKAVRVARGRKVPVGTEGVVIWLGESRYGLRVGVKDAAGTVHWTAAGNVEVLVDETGEAIRPVDAEREARRAAEREAALAAPEYTIGMVVRVVRESRGTPAGTTGRIFWKGTDRFTGGSRYGLKGPGGVAYWVGGADLAAAAA